MDMIHDYCTGRTFLMASAALVLQLPCTDIQSVILVKLQDCSILFYSAHCLYLLILYLFYTLMPSIYCLLCISVCLYCTLILIVGIQPLR